MAHEVSYKEGKKGGTIAVITTPSRLAGKPSPYLHPDDLPSNQVDEPQEPEPNVVTAPATASEVIDKPWFLLDLTH